MMNRDLIICIESLSERSSPCKFSLSYSNYFRLSVPSIFQYEMSLKGGRDSNMK